MTIERRIGIRENIELVQPYGKKVVFTHVLSSDDSEVIVDISKHMLECNRISLLVDNHDTYIRFVDANDNINKAERVEIGKSSIESFLLIEGSGYFDDNIQLDGKVMAITARPADTLYLVSSRDNALYVLNYETGRSDRVSQDTLRNFGVGETDPSGLTVVDTTLYMVGKTNQVLYNVHLASGIARQVGSEDAGFGVGENAPTGLATIYDDENVATVYMIGQTTNRLYTMNIEDGSATVVDASTTNFGVGETEATGLSAINNILYMVGEVNRRLYTLDTSDGSANPVGSATEFGVGITNPVGLASIDDTLYLIGKTASADLHESTIIVDSVFITETAEYVTSLYELDTSTGIATLLTDADSFSSVFTQTEPAGLASIQTGGYYGRIRGICWGRS